jgi:hypothetical protein
MSGQTRTTRLITATGNSLRIPKTRVQSDTPGRYGERVRGIHPACPLPPDMPYLRTPFEERPAAKTVVRMSRYAFHRYALWRRLFEDGKAEGQTGPPPAVSSGEALLSDSLDPSAENANESTSDAPDQEGPWGGDSTSARHDADVVEHQFAAVVTFTWTEPRRQVEPQ